MENNFDNLTPDTEDISVIADAVSDDTATVVSEAEEAVALAEEYTTSADILENLPELQEEKKSKRAKKAKKEKAPKAKKEKAPKEKKAKAPKVKKEKEPKVAMSEDEKAKRILSKRKKFHFMNLRIVMGIHIFNEILERVSLLKKKVIIPLDIKMLLMRQKTLKM